MFVYRTPALRRFIAEANRIIGNLQIGFQPAAPFVFYPVYLSTYLSFCTEPPRAFDSPVVDVRHGVWVAGANLQRRLERGGALVQRRAIQRALAHRRRVVGVQQGDAQRNDGGLALAVVVGCL